MPTDRNNHRQNSDPSVAKVIGELTDLYNDLQMAVAPRSYSEALLHCIAALRAAIEAAEHVAETRRTPMAERVIPFQVNRRFTMGRDAR